MIHIGIKLYPHALKAVALADGFEPIGNLFCKSNKYYRFLKWLNNLKWDISEHVVVFLDDFEFMQFKYCHENIFFNPNRFNKIYLVHHTKLTRLMSVFRGYNAYTKNKPQRMSKAFMLACVRKIYPARQFSVWNPEDELDF
jgi:hypothetical protein